MAQLVHALEAETALDSPAIVLDRLAPERTSLPLPNAAPSSTVG
jgi:hypothetical protein